MIDKRKPDLLFLCQTLPFPPDGGVQIRSYNILRLLSKAFNVTALCFYRATTRPSAADVRSGVAGLSQFCDAQAFPIPHELSKLRTVWDHARSLVTMRVYTRFTYDSADFRREVQTVLSRRQFSLVHLDSLDLSAYLPEISGIPIVCTHHNIESSLLSKRALTESNPFASGYFRLQAALMEREERRWCGRFALNIVVSPDDGERLKALIPEAKLAVIPNGVDVNAFKPTDVATDGLVFVGGYGWHPNREGMNYFLQEILPRLRQVRPGVKVTWIGRAPEPVMKDHAAKHGVQMLGYVDDIRPAVSEASCYIVPLRTGGGTRLKILDAWAMGKAVVSTAIGCEGLKVRDGENILIRDEPDAFAQAVNRVLGDAALRRALGSNARRTAEAVYDWELLGSRMNELYAQLAEGAADSIIEQV